jgi:hypothetical protein
MLFSKNSLRKDAIITFTLSLSFNAYYLISHGSLEYLNLNKVIFALISSTVIFLPMLLIVRTTSGQRGFPIVLFSASVFAWATYPFLMSMAVGETFNSTWGGVPIYIDGNLTLRGYAYKLENTFLMLIAYSSFLTIKNLLSTRGSQNGRIQD